VGNSRFDLLVIIFIAVCAFVLSLVPFEVDIYVYLAAGKAFFQNGLSLFVDHSSTVLSGKTIAPNPWLFSLLVGFVDWAGGLNALIGLRYLIVLTPLLVAFYFLRRHLSMGNFYVISILAVLLISFYTRMQFRPEMVSYTFVMLFLGMASRALQNNNIKALDLLLPVLIVWAQFHSTVVFGYLIILMAYVCFALHEVQSSRTNLVKNSFQIIARVVVVVASGFVSPYPLQFHPLLTMFVLKKNEFAPYIAEFIEVHNFDSAINIYVWIVAILMVAYSVYRKNLFGLGLLLVYMAFTLNMAKVFPHMAVIVMYFFAMAVSNLSVSSVNVKRVVKLIMASGLIISSYHLANVLAKGEPVEPFGRNRLVEPSMYPIDVVDYMNRSSLTGKVAAEDFEGTYVTYALEGLPKVSIDVRYNVLFPFSYFESWMTAMRVPFRLKKHFEAWDYDYTIARHRDTDSLFDTVTRMRGVSVEYIGNFHTLFKNRGGNYPAATALLWEPSCIDQIDVSQIRLEKERAIRTQGAESALANLLEVAEAYRSRPKGVSSSDLKLDTRSVFSSRLLAYFVFSENNWDATFFTMKLVKPYRFTDILLLAETLYHLGRYDTALKMLASLDSDGIAGDETRWKRYNQVKGMIESKSGLSLGEVEGPESDRRLIEESIKILSPSDISLLRTCSQSN
jgi:hypothetical protein